MLKGEHMLIFLKRLLEITMGGERFQLQSAYTVDESILRLNEKVKSTSAVLRHPIQNTLIGHVGRDQVKLTYHQRGFLDNPFAPVFKGGFENIDGVTILIGHFALPWFSKLFIGACACILILSIAAPLLNLVLTSSEPIQKRLLPVLVMPFVTLLALSLVIVPWIWLGLANRQCIMKSIEDALQ